MSEVEDRHQPMGRVTHSGVESNWDICRECETPMPCDVRIVLDMLAAERERAVRVIEAYQAYVDHIIVGWRLSSGQEKRRALDLWTAVEEATDAIAAAAAAPPAPTEIEIIEVRDGDLTLSAEDLAPPPAAPAAAEIVDCTRCGEPISDGYMIGDGDGTGRRFAHPECYREYPGAYKYRQPSAAGQGE